MDWINCNLCCRQPGDERNRVFMLSSCGHIFCDLCLTQDESKKCKVCSAKCQLIQLSSKMKPDAEVFFQEPSDLLKKQNAQMNRLLEFQKEHRIRLVSFHRKMLVKYKELEKRYRLASEKVLQLEKENCKLKQIINSGGVGEGEYGSLGPGLSPHNSYQRALNDSARRNSPQGIPGSLTSPGAMQINGRRLTLAKNKQITVPTNRTPNYPLNDARTVMKSREVGKIPSPHSIAKRGTMFATPLGDANAGSMYRTPEMTSRIFSPQNAVNGHCSQQTVSGSQLPPTTWYQNRLHLSGGLTPQYARTSNYS